MRVGASVLTLLGIIFGGILSAFLWFEIARECHRMYTVFLSSRDLIVDTPGMTGAESAAFVVAGIMETVFFIVSVLGYDRNVHNGKAHV